MILTSYDVNLIVRNPKTKQVVIEFKLRLANLISSESDKYQNRLNNSAKKLHENCEVDLKRNGYVFKADSLSENDENNFPDLLQYSDFILPFIKMSKEN